ncbi:MAG: Stp1/IreP family PP2C-type Ser/Thr phosphatase [Chitinophagaceae bacterium]
MEKLKAEQAGLSDIGNVRQANEDSFGFLEGPYGSIFSVCDGMGGHVGGATASSLAVKVILEFISTSEVDNPSVTINNALISANQRILEAAEENPELKGMGTTATVLLVQPEAIYLGHVGDSRIYIFSSGELYRLTSDHSFVQTLVDNGAITEEQAETHPRKNELLKALGVNDAIQPTLSQPVKPIVGDILMLCTDGLCGLVNDGQMQQVLQSNPSLASAADQLVLAAKQAGGYDNITVQLIKITGSPYKTSEFHSFTHKVAGTGAAYDTSTIKETNNENDGTGTNSGKTGQGSDNGIIKKQNNIRKYRKLFMLGITAVLVLFLFATYKTNVWPFGNKQVLSDSTRLNQPNGDGVLPGDRFVPLYLMHTVSADEKDLDKIIRERKKLGGLYNNINYDTTYSLDNKPVDQNNLSNIRLIKWKVRNSVAGLVATGAENSDSGGILPVTNIVVTADSVNAAKQGRDAQVSNTIKPNQPADGAEQQLKGLNNRLTQYDKQLQHLKQQLTEKEIHYKNMSDSLKAHQKDKKWELKVTAAKKELDAARMSIEKTESNRQMIQKRIDAMVVVR